MTRLATIRPIPLLFLCCTLALSGQTDYSKQPQPPYASARPLPEPKVFGEGIISTGDDESHPAFTRDGRTLYFLKNTPLFDHWTIVVSHFSKGRWSTPEVAPFSGQYSDADPFITSDGGKLFFISTRPVGGKPKQDTDIWLVERSLKGWSEPKHLGSVVNSDEYEWFPTIADNGNLYFGSARPGGKGKTDIWRAKLVDGAYGEPENLGDAINTPAREVEPYISPDERFMIFAAADRPDSKGAFDLYISYNENGLWTKAEALGEKINSAAWDFAPKISPDGRYFFFTSNRSSTGKPFERRLNYRELIEKLHGPRNGLRDIYQIDIGALKLNHPLPSRQ
jgi:Tol biopolymer transport system component